MISEIFSGVTPWHNLTKLEQKVEAFLIMKKPFPIAIEIKEQYPQFLELITKCTKVDYMERCTTEDIIDYLTPFLKTM